MTRRESRILDLVLAALLLPAVLLTLDEESTSPRDPMTTGLFRMVVDLQQPWVVVACVHVVVHLG
jgi:hypothetical protein